ncbi:hypothetical protein ACLI09_17845 [Flavobacterium sp. RHBU_24]|uniref:hypothetical protein n=1 Tax=Flavobacterium sp. RHBU_24 TaxID=3391185 RepID=UPI0039849A92
MHTIEIPEAKLKRYVPKYLGECDSGQYIEMCVLLYRYTAGQLSYFDLRVQALYTLLDMVPSNRQLLIVDEEAKWANMYRVSLLVDGFFNELEGQKQIRLEHIHNPLPKFRPLWRTYHALADGFINATFGEYLDGLRLFYEFGKSPNENLLYELTGIFYRKAAPWRMLKPQKGDVREAYNPHTVEARARTFRYAPVGFVFGFYLTFAAFQKYITSAIVPWGGQELDLSILFESSDDGHREAVPGLGMDSIAFALAESGQLGDLGKVREANLWQVFLLLYNLKKNELDYKFNSKAEK